MVLFGCFPALSWKKKKDKKTLKSLNSSKEYKILPAKLEHSMKYSNVDELSPTSLASIPFNVKENLICKVKVMSLEAAEVAYEGEDEHEQISPIKIDISDLNFPAQVGNSSGEDEKNLNFSDISQKDAEECAEFIESGHVSDPGRGKAEFWASPKLKRSCSDLGMREVLKELVSRLPSPKSQSFEELQKLDQYMMKDFQNPGSPGSVMSHRSADRVMLKKHSSAQILPSRSRRLWWKLFLWSHRNLHNHPLTPSKTSLPRPLNTASNQQGGYTSDTLEPNRAMKLSQRSSPGSFTGELRNNGNNNDNLSMTPRWNGLHGRFSGLWPQNQWVAFSTESPSFDRVDEWVREIGNQPRLLVDNEENEESGTFFPASPENGGSPARISTQFTRHRNTNLSEEILHANSIIQSLNSSTTVAHIAGIGLKVVPSISRFSTLRSVNLSNNLIVHIPPGSLPKGLHKLDLSRNKINTIEGLRELTRLRTLDLSHNRISRIGQGLSNCQRIKELYLAGNKISDIEGLHRLLKLTVLDLSFNKITTTKALGQLVANYNSLLALNLLGNSVQNNVSEDQLRKAVCGLLPKLAYLNKQPIKPQRASEVINDSVAKAVLGNSSRSSRRKAVKRVSQGGSLSPTVHRGSASAKSRLRKKNQTHRSPLKTRLSAAVS